MSYGEGIRLSGYGEVVRETAAERHDRHVAAVEQVLRPWIKDVNQRWVVAEECLDAAETGV